MQQIINFILRNKVFLLYLTLLFVSLVFTIQSHSYHKSKFVNSANFISGGIYNSANNIDEYFHLKNQNILLQEENNYLKSILYNSSDSLSKAFNDTTRYGGNYRFIPAIVIKNSYSATDNILLVNRGKKDSLKEDLGVITSKGILGIIDKTSKNYATVLSILNTNSRISAKLKNTNHFGSLQWNTKSPNVVQLKEIPKIAPLKEGDTILTSGLSAIFPKNIPIGSIQSFELDEAENFYNIEVKLFNDMTNIEHVYVIENRDKEEIDSLLNNRNE